MIADEKSLIYFIVNENDLSINNDYKNDEPSEIFEEEEKRRSLLLNIDEDIKAYRGLVSYVAQLLILNGGSMRVREFDYEFFDKLNTEQFGTRKQIIQKLKQQKWMNEYKDNEHVFYELGTRFSIETSIEWQYSECYELVNNSKPAVNDEGLQRILSDKENRQKLIEHKNRNGNTKRGQRY